MTRDNLESPPAHSVTPSRQRLPTIRAIGPDELQTRHPGFEPGQEPACALLIGGIGGRDLSREEEPQRIHQQMPFPALAQFAAVIALDEPRCFRGFHTLAGHDRRRGFGITSSLQADATSQGFVDPLPDPLQAPPAERRLHRLPGGTLSREVAPCTAGAQDVEDRVDEPPWRPAAGPAAPRWPWQPR
jgi:hypothetical protein